MSGLTLGLMSLDVVDLEVSPPASASCKACCLLLAARHLTDNAVIITASHAPGTPPVLFGLQVLVRSGTPNEKKYAKRIQPVSDRSCINVAVTCYASF